jgi:predicted RNase H-related nuclease YkuK (DUF458 family)
MYRNKFKQFGGQWIPDIIEYLKSKIELDPGITISVGCDSVQKRKRTIYACTIMLYNNDIRNGAHVVFFRESHDKIRDNQSRLHKEAQLALDIAEFLNTELEGFYSRKDLSQFERQKYKFHLLRCNGEYLHLQNNDVESFVKNLTLSEFEKTNPYKLVDIHIDFNPFEGESKKNKSNVAYNAYVPWLKGMGYRVWSKLPNSGDSAASTSAADLLLRD